MSIDVVKVKHTIINKMENDIAYHMKHHSSRDFYRGGQWCSEESEGCLDESDACHTDDPDVEAAVDLFWPLRVIANV